MPQLGEEILYDRCLMVAINPLRQINPLLDRIVDDPLGDESPNPYIPFEFPSKFYADLFSTWNPTRPGLNDFFGENRWTGYITSTIPYDETYPPALVDDQGWIIAPVPPPDATDYSTRVVAYKPYGPTVTLEGWNPTGFFDRQTGKFLGFKYEMGTAPTQQYYKISDPKNLLANGGSKFGFAQFERVGAFTRVIDNARLGRIEHYLISTGLAVSNSNNLPRDWYVYFKSTNLILTLIIAYPGETINSSWAALPDSADVNSAKDGLLTATGNYSPPINSVSNYLFEYSHRINVSLYNSGEGLSSYSKGGGGELAWLSMEDSPSKITDDFSQILEKYSISSIGQLRVLLQVSKNDPIDWKIQKVDYTETAITAEYIMRFGSNRYEGSFTKQANAVVRDLIDSSSIANPPGVDPTDITFMSWLAFTLDVPTLQLDTLSVVWTEYIHSYDGTNHTWNPGSVISHTYDTKDPNNLPPPALIPTAEVHLWEYPGGYNAMINNIYNPANNPLLCGGNFIIVGNTAYRPTLQQLVEKAQLNGPLIISRGKRYEVVKTSTGTSTYTRSGRTDIYSKMTGVELYIDNTLVAAGTFSIGEYPLPGGDTMVAVLEGDRLRIFWPGGAVETYEYHGPPLDEPHANAIPMPVAF